jgi:hypothetical protein
MIDWNKATPEDFELRVEGEGIQESGNHIIFPVQVFHQDGTPAFLKSIPIRLEFYDALNKTADCKTALMKIIRQRVRDELAERLQPPSIPVADKVDWIDFDKQPLKENQTG